MAGQHHDRAFHILLSHHLAQLATIRIWQPNIQDNQIKAFLRDMVQRLLPVCSLLHHEFLRDEQLI